MSTARPDFLAATDRMRALYGTPAPTPVGTELLRRQLGELPDHIGAAIADAANRPTLQKLDALVMQLGAAMRLAQQLRQALAAEIDGSASDA